MCRTGTVSVCVCMRVLTIRRVLNNGKSHLLYQQNWFYVNNIDNIDLLGDSLKGVGAGFCFLFLFN